MKIIPYEKEPFCLVISPNHKLATVEEVRIEDLKNEPLIIRENRYGSRYAILSLLGSHRINPVVLLAADSIEFIKEYIMKGKGISFLYQPEFRSETGRGLLKAVRVKEGPLVLQADIVYPRNVDLSPPAQTFLRLIEREEE